MALNPDVKKILCDRKVAALASACADLAGQGKFTDEQLVDMTALDEEWLAATEKVINGPVK